MSFDLESRVQRRLDNLTKPPGSLGELEALAKRYCLLRGEYLPELPRKAMYLFCADHGITEEGISPYPKEVTAQMVANFRRGGAAINVLCRAFEIEPVILDCGVGAGTRNFAKEPAMSVAQAREAFERGRAELAPEAATRFELVGTGEMGIGNTTSAAALLSVFSGRPAAETAGRGAGLDDEGVRRKVAVLQRALDYHRPDPARPLEALAAVGGLEIATMAGFIAGCAGQRLPVVIDGFISCSAALAARALAPGCLDNAFFSHRSAERAHTLMLDTLGARPLLDLGMRLGEGSGAALLMNLIDTSLRVYRQMATFEEAGVSDVK
jgi:nicotinate-nucleotide--dimethylbenzimidazole phosphoribosyltransferase